MSQSIKINGRQELLTGIEDRQMLGDFLRDQLHLTGTHLGCEHGICGACTITIDGQPARSCITLAKACSGADVRTIEGYDIDPLMVKLREAFTKAHALQCGYCTPGMLIAARDLILRYPSADEKTIRLEMSGNLCRCTGYMGIVTAIQNVIASLRPDDINQNIFKTDSKLGWPSKGQMGPVGSCSPVQTTRGLDQIGVALNQNKTEPIGHQIQEIKRPDSSSLIVIQDSILIKFPAPRVWELISQVNNVAPCLPGLSIKKIHENGNLTVALQISLGPISTYFEGLARFKTDSADLTGLVFGKAKDRRSGTVAQGEISFKLAEVEHGQSTSINLEIGYSLSGPLAQFSRGTIARDIAKSLTQSFGKNMALILEGSQRGIEAKPLENQSLSLGGVLWKLAMARISALMKWFFKNGR